LERSRTVAAGGVDRGEPIGFMDIGQVQGAQVVDRTGYVIVVKWGPLRTLTVDLARRTVVFVESDPSSQGRGEVHCNVGGW
jgi:hypothetical protein